MGLAAISLYAVSLQIWLEFRSPVQHLCNRKKQTDAIFLSRKGSLPDIMSVMPECFLETRLRRQNLFSDK